MLVSGGFRMDEPEARSQKPEAALHEMSTSSRIISIVSSTPVATLRLVLDLEFSSFVLQPQRCSVIHRTL